MISLNGKKLITTNVVNIGSSPVLSMEYFATNNIYLITLFIKVPLEMKIVFNVKYIYASLAQLVRAIDC